MKLHRRPALSARTIYRLRNLRHRSVTQLLNEDGERLATAADLRGLRLS